MRKLQAGDLIRVWRGDISKGNASQGERKKKLGTGVREGERTASGFIKTNRE